MELSAFESSGLINRLAIAQLSTGQFTEISVVSSETCPALLAAMVDCPSWMLRTIAKQPMILNPLMLTSGCPTVHQLIAPRDYLVLLAATACAWGQYPRSKGLLEVHPRVATTNTAERTADRGGSRKHVPRSSPGDRSLFSLARFFGCMISMRCRILERAIEVGK